MVHGGLRCRVIHFKLFSSLHSLGDRHAENILFDFKTGDCVHVDFACLFEKGKTLDVPERVPFRLTQNMVDAFGIQKYEGVFRRACEVTMSVLRANKDMLMNVLETFIHDPLVEWSKILDSKRRISPLQVIDKKLQGIPLEDEEDNKAMPLSVQGQVHWLIQEATSQENLSKMYVWWSKYLY